MKGTFLVCCFWSRSCLNNDLVLQREAAHKWCWDLGPSLGKKKRLKCLGKKQSRTSLKEYIQYGCIIIRHLKIIYNNENTSVLVLLQLKLSSSSAQGLVFQLKFSSLLALSKIAKILISFKPKIVGTVQSSDFFRSSWRCTLCCKRLVTSWNMRKAWRSPQLADRRVCKHRGAFPGHQRSLQSLYYFHWNCAAEGVLPSSTISKVSTLDRNCWYFSTSDLLKQTKKYKIEAS